MFDIRILPFFNEPETSEVSLTMTVICKHSVRNINSITQLFKVSSDGFIRLYTYISFVPIEIQLVTIQCY